MCGIVGIKSFHKLESLDRNRVAAMNDLLIHRGPDDSGIFESEKCILAHRRLSIIDLSKDGHQPFYSKDRRYVIVFNGEIYNYIELREELILNGIAFSTKTDTEVLLNAYIEWGVDSFHKLNGMFAFAIYDSITEDLILVRDRFGVKPIYYYAENGKIVFSSEILPILKTSGQKFKANEQLIYDYLVYNRTNHTEDTFFEGIKKLPHGHYLRIANSGMEKVKWYSLTDNIKKSFGSSSDLKDQLCSAIELRMRSDVPVGTSLSGGIDSSSIASLLANHFELKSFHSFSAVYKTNHRSNEKDYIDSLTIYPISMNFIYPDAVGLLGELKEFVKVMNEPVPTTSIYALYKVYESAKQKVTVMLDGQGADESLAGYGYFRGYYYKDLLKNFQIFKFILEIIKDLFYLRSLEGLFSFFYFLSPVAWKDWLIRRKISYLGNKFKKTKGSFVIIQKLWNAKSLKEALLAHFQYKIEHLLAWGDKTSMAHSIEVRYPFLDYRFVERAIGVDGPKLLKDGYNKYILREAVKGIVPEKIRTRRQKIGFETPEAEWFRTESFQKQIDEILNSESFQNRGYINPLKAKALYKDHLEKKIDCSGEIWKWINLELWAREFID